MATVQQNFGAGVPTPPATPSPTTGNDTKITFSLTTENFGTEVVANIPFGNSPSANIGTKFKALNAWANIGSVVRVYGGYFSGTVKKVPRYNDSVTNFDFYNNHAVFYPVSAARAVGNVETDGLQGPAIFELGRFQGALAPFTFQFAWIGDSTISVPEDDPAYGGIEGNLPNKLGARLYTTGLSDLIDFYLTWTWAARQNNFGNTAAATANPIYADIAVRGAGYENTLGAWVTFKDLANKKLNFTVGYAALLPVVNTLENGTVSGVYFKKDWKPTLYYNALELGGSIQFSDTAKLVTQNNASVGWYGADGEEFMTGNDYPVKVLTTDFVLTDYLGLIIGLDSAARFELRPVVKNILLIKTASIDYDGTKYADEVTTTDILTVAADLRYNVNKNAYAWIGAAVKETFAQYLPRKPGAEKDNGDLVIYHNVLILKFPIGMQVKF
jgi:hypothetical protein